MRIHSDILTTGDVYRATSARGMRGVDADATSHGSRSRACALDVSLTGTSSRRPNTGTRGAGGYGIDYAATWDEWGMILAELFAIDPRAFVGSTRHPIYAGAEHFHAVTADRFRTLVAADQHGGPGHRWGSILEPGGDYRQECACGATWRHVDPAPYVARLSDGAA